MKYQLLLLLTASFFQTCAQSKFNPQLKRELDSISRLNDMSRNFAKAGNVERVADSIMKAKRLKNPSELLTYLNGLQKKYDSSNFTRIKAIVQQYGYPGKSLVGTPTNEVTVSVLEKYLYEHPEEFQQYLPFLKKAAEASEFPFKLYAPFLDKSLMKQGKEQVYGTQIMSVEIAAGSGNRKFTTMKWIVWPIKDAATVNERRKAIGINETVEDYAKANRFTYEALALEDIKRLRGN